MTSDPPPPAPFSTLRTRPTLLFRLRDWKDETSWAEFYRLYYSFVYGCARRSGLPHADAEEVTQDVFRGVAEKVKEFEVRERPGSFRAWLLKLTRWRIADKYRARAPHESQPPLPVDDDPRTALIERLPDAADPEKWWEEEWQYHVLDAALLRLSRRVSPKHYQIFDLYYRQGCSVLAVAKQLEVGVPSVYLVTHRLMKQLRKELVRLREQIG